MTSRSLRAILLCLVPPLIWGGMFPIAGLLVPTVNMFAMTLIRYVFVGIILAVMLGSSEGRLAFHTDSLGWRLFFLGSAGFAGFGLLAFTALSYTSSSNVSLIMAMMPAISAVLAAAATRKAPPGFTIVAIVIAFFGVSLVLTNGDYTHLISLHDGLGELLALLGAICWVVYTRGAALFPTWSVLRYTSVTTALGCITIAAATIVATVVGYVKTPSVEDVMAGWPELAYLIVLAGVVAVLSWNKGNRLLGPLNGTLFMNLVPVTTFSIAAIVSGGLPSVPAIVGCALVIAGLLLNNFFARRSARAAAMKAAVAPRSVDMEEASSKS